MARHVVWQTILALLGIALIFIILTRPAPPVVVQEVPAPGGTYIEGVLGYADTINPILAPLWSRPTRWTRTCVLWSLTD